MGRLDASVRARRRAGRHGAGPRARRDDAGHGRRVDDLLARHRDLVRAVPDAARGLRRLPAAVDLPADAEAGVLLLADWLTARGGGYGPISRPCSGSSTSEHKESRAFDWLLDARSDADKALAAALLDEIFAPDDTGAPHALARRMGIMYVIWNDHMYASYDGFVAKRYLSSSCRSRRTCSPTLRHRDHMHISLTRQGAKGTTSWYLAQPSA